MSLNIKNEEAHKMAAELAEIRGVSMTAAVVEALRKELASRPAKSGRRCQGRGNDLRGLKRINKGRRRDDGSTSDHSWLYDENGLPVCRPPDGN